MADDDDAIINDAIARGILANAQYNALYAAAQKCWAAADKLPPDKKPDAFAICKGIDHKADVVAAAMDRIDNGISGGHGVPGITARSAAQEASDRLYDMVYWQYFNKSPEEQQRAYEDALARSSDLPSKRPTVDALGALLHGGGYNPPLYNPGPQAPHPSGPEQPVT